MGNEGDRWRQHRRLAHRPSLWPRRAVTAQRPIRSPARAERTADPSEHPQPIVRSLRAPSERSVRSNTLGCSTARIALSNTRNGSFGQMCQIRGTTTRSSAHYSPRILKAICHCHRRNSQRELLFGHDGSAVFPLSAMWNSESSWLGILRQLWHRASRATSESRRRHHRHQSAAAHPEFNESF
jgi:hypothetical protein